MMTCNELAQYQHDQTSGILYSLVMSCRERFLRSADLVQLRVPAVTELRQFGATERIDVSALIPAWQHLCARYLSECYDPQMSFFDDHRDRETTRWDQFAYSKLLPMLIGDDEVVRNVLRATGGLPCRARLEAAQCLDLYIGELSLPSLRPPWSSENEIET